MISRQRPLLAALFASGLLACQTETVTPDCLLEQQATIPGTALTLLPGARIDRVAQWFVLMGAEGRTVRWATVETDGRVGPEQSADVPPFTAGPWFAVAGSETAGDTMLIAFGKPATTPTDLEIHLIAASIDGSAPPSAPTVVTTIPGVAQPNVSPRVVMASSRTGQRAGLGWVVPTASAVGAPASSPVAGAGTIKTLLLSGNGRSIGDPREVETVAGSSCLNFVPGLADLTLAYLAYDSAVATEPAWSVAELRDNAATEFTLSLDLGSVRPTCPQVTATAAGGYALAWQDPVGSRLGLYDPGVNRLNVNLFVTAVEFGGPELQPPLVGLGQTSRDFVVLFARARSGEVWRVDALGRRRPGRLILPSAVGDMGQVSALPLAEAVYATYADYLPSSGDGGSGDLTPPILDRKGGLRYFVRIGCF